jgi:hypothetical protein
VKVGSISHRPEARPLAAPDDRRERADDLVALALLDQVEVLVPRRARPQARDLARDPDRGEGLAQELLHLAPEPGDAVGRLAAPGRLLEQVQGDLPPQW